MPKHYFLLALLVAATLPLVWKAKSLEKRLFDHTHNEALLNKPAPEFTLPTLTGEPVSTKDFRGKKKLVVSFWASWCEPCRMELPELEAFYESYHAASRTFEVLAISTDEDRREAERYARNTKLTFPVLWDEQGKTEDAYGVEGIPMLFVIDENGKVVYAQDGYEFGMQSKLRQALGMQKNGAGAGAANDDTRD
ncbi:MAG TPA: TlpA disulfide reductase family protein [Verrucomicrobiae bacterium]|nr:TlpA disulfide reductase family protein [Verrucomicrobiae bacterium]